MHVASNGFPRIWLANSMVASSEEGEAVKETKGQEKFEKQQKR